MKKLLRIAIVLFVGALSIEGASAADASLGARMDACFRSLSQVCRLRRREARLIHVRLTLDHSPGCNVRLPSRSRRGYAFE
jgi:hypothetical protein